MPSNNKSTASFKNQNPTNKQAQRTYEARKKGENTYYYISKCKTEKERKNNLQMKGRKKSERETQRTEQQKKNRKEKMWKKKRIGVTNAEYAYARIQHAVS